MKKQDKCPACGIDLSKHTSQADLCRKLEAACSTVQVISTWATFQGGIELVPEHVARLCGRTLERILGAMKSRNACQACAGEDAMTRAEWLASLVPGSQVILQTSVGRYPALVTAIDEYPDRTGKHRVWMRILKPVSSLLMWNCWVYLETGELKNHALRIEPDDDRTHADDCKLALQTCAPT